MEVKDKLANRIRVRALREAPLTVQQIEQVERFNDSLAEMAESTFEVFSLLLSLSESG